MSWRLMDAALMAPHLRPVERLVLLHLARCASDDGYHLAWPSQSMMAAAIGVSDRAVRRALSVLVARGMISRAGRRGRIQIYSVHIDATEITGAGVRSKPALVSGEQSITGAGVR